MQEPGKSTVLARHVVRAGQECRVILRPGDGFVATTYGWGKPSGLHI